VSRQHLEQGVDFIDGRAEWYGKEARRFTGSKKNSAKWFFFLSGPELTADFLSPLVVSDQIAL
jgi:hypothetical protein